MFCNNVYLNNDRIEQDLKNVITEIQNLMRNSVMLVFFKKNNKNNGIQPKIMMCSFCKDNRKLFTVIENKK